MPRDVLMLHDALRVRDLLVPSLGCAERQRQKHITEFNRLVCGIANEDRPIERVGFNSEAFGQLQVGVILVIQPALWVVNDRKLLERSPRA